VKAHDFYLQHFLRNLSQNNKSPHTLKNYEADIRKFLHWIQQFNRLHLTQIKSHHIDEYRHFLQTGMLKKRRLFRTSTTINSRPMAIASQRRQITAIKVFYEFLLAYYPRSKRIILKQNPIKPMLHQVKLKDIDVTHTQRLNLKQFEQMVIHHPKKADQLLLKLLFWGGLRCEELTNLKLSDFDEEAESLRIQRKGGEIHLLKIQNFHQLFHLAKVVTHNKADHYLFSTNKKAISSRAIHYKVQKMFHRANIQGLGLSVHSFRKGCATELYKKTKDLLLVRDYLNHKNALVTQTYIEI
jgi:integrase/recombinase XerC